MEEVRYGVIGNVDSGKSTLIGVIVGKELDDGKGKARLTILRHPHEKKTGRTSSISQNFIKVNKNKYLNFIDLAGHERNNWLLYRLCYYCYRSKYGNFAYDKGTFIYCIGY